ncbi:HLA class II histocompatibility antigen gamma chain-like [Heptranchias perlo]|uniref:HLA class II histocompatibility antigen gamma chain-like n=1 Tax=Heptranchias perlo TaxID=212740 RepID=UPI00355A9B0B
MATDEQQNALLNNSQQDITSNAAVETGSVATGQSRRQCSRGFLWTGVSVLAAVLIAGQVVSVMYLLKQQDKISDLQKTTSRIESKYSASRSPSRPKTMMHLRPMMMDLPIAYIDPSAVKPKAPEPTPAKPKTLQEQVWDLLKKENTTKEIPELNNTFSANLNTLRETMKESDWQDFEAWLRNWLLFQLVQEEEEKATTTVAPRTQPQPQPKGRRIFSSMALSPMLVDQPITSDRSKHAKAADVVPKSEVREEDTECEKRHKEIKVVPGVYRPSCDEMGNYKAKQCWPSTGYCWCMFLNGTEVPGTRTRHPLDSCENYRQAEEPNISGVGAMN